MTELSDCPSCGRRIPANAPSGICPNCLIQAGMNNYDDPTVTPVSHGGFVPPDVAQLASQFSQLEILEPLGHGGMGAVYKARQTKLDRLVALKVIRPESAVDETFAQRFNREARTLAKLNHPNIVAVHDFGEFTLPDEDGLPRTLFYFVMEYVDGADLRQLIDAEMSPDQAMAVISQICDALQYAHDEGIVHRDIKPENILLDSQGKVKIADFGLAKLASKSDRDLSLTGTHQVMGTPRYMAPEQMEGSRTVDHRADVYSLGVVFYEMLTGEVPMGQFEPPSKKSSVDVRLDDIVLQAMAREPDRRFQRASEIRDNLAEIAGWRAPIYADGAVPGPSTILEVGAQRAFAAVRRQVVGQSAVHPAFIGIPALILSIVGVCVHIAMVDDNSHIYNSRRIFRTGTDGMICAGIVLFLLTLVLLAFGSAKRRTVLRPWLIFLCGAIALAADLAFLLNLSDQQRFDARYTCGVALACGVGLVLLGGWDIGEGVAERRRNRTKKKRKALPESAHVGFVVPSGKSLAKHIAPHFQMLGYQLVSQSTYEWIFERGSRTGHMGVDLRKCFTVLTVRTGPRPDGGQWVSCGWAVQAFVTGGEVTKLEMEGQSLARSLGIDSVTLTKSESKQVLPGQTMVSFLGGSSRGGRWRPPSRLNVFSILGGCELDFRDAQLDPGVNEVNIMSILSGVEIIAPPNLPVEVSGMSFLGAFEQDGSGKSPEDAVNSPTLRITGLSILGGVSVTTKR